MQDTVIVNISKVRLTDWWVKWMWNIASVPNIKLIHGSETINLDSEHIAFLCCQ